MAEGCSSEDAPKLKLEDRTRSFLQQSKLTDSPDPLAQYRQTLAQLEEDQTKLLAQKAQLQLDRLPLEQAHGQCVGTAREQALSCRDNAAALAERLATHQTASAPLNSALEALATKGTSLELASAYLAVVGRLQNAVNAAEADMLKVCDG